MGGTAKQIGVFLTTNDDALVVALSTPRSQCWTQASKLHPNTIHVCSGTERHIEVWNKLFLSPISQT